MSFEPIENYGAIGNMRSIALVGVNGSIDFLSYPDFAWFQRSAPGKLSLGIYALGTHQRRTLSEPSAHRSRRARLALEFPRAIQTEES